MATKPKRILSVGDMFYYLGSPTRIKVIGDLDMAYPVCEILEVGPSSKFKPGEKVSLSRRAFFPRKKACQAGKKVKKS